MSKRILDGNRSMRKSTERSVIRRLVIYSSLAFLIICTVAIVWLDPFAELRPSKGHVPVYNPNSTGSAIMGPTGGDGGGSGGCLGNGGILNGGRLGLHAGLDLAGLGLNGGDAGLTLFGLDRALCGDHSARGQRACGGGDEHELGCILLILFHVLIWPLPSSAKASFP